MLDPSLITAVAPIIAREGVNLLSSKRHKPSDPSLVQLQESLLKLESEISNLKSQQGHNVSEKQIASIVSEIQEARNQAYNLDNVIFPKDLNLRLVRADLLDRLDEYRSDQSYNFLMLGLFGGASLAIVINWATAQDGIKTDFSISLLVVLLLLIMFFAFKSFKLNQRAEIVKKKMLEE